MNNQMLPGSLLFEYVYLEKVDRSLNGTLSTTFWYKNARQTSSEGKKKAIPISHFFIIFVYKRMQNLPAVNIAPKHCEQTFVWY